MKRLMTEMIATAAGVLFLATSTVAMAGQGTTGANPNPPLQAPGIPSQPTFPNQPGVGGLPDPVHLLEQDVKNTALKALNWTIGRPYGPGKDVKLSSGERLKDGAIGVGMIGASALVAGLLIAGVITAPAWVPAAVIGAGLLGVGVVGAHFLGTAISGVKRIGGFLGGIFGGGGGNNNGGGSGNGGTTPKVPAPPAQPNGPSTVPTAGGPTPPSAGSTGAGGGFHKPTVGTGVGLPGPGSTHSGAVNPANGTTTAPQVGVGGTGNNVARNDNTSGTPSIQPPAVGSHIPLPPSVSANGNEGFHH